MAVLHSILQFVCVAYLICCFPVDLEHIGGDLDLVTKLINLRFCFYENMH